MLTMIFSIVIMSIMAETLTELAVKSQIFLTTRTWLSGKSDFLKELLHCGYCFSVWMAFFVIVVTGLFIPLTGRAILDGFITLLVVHRLSNVLHNVIDKWTDKYYDTRFINTDKSGN